MASPEGHGGSAGGASTPASTYGIAVAPAVSFAFSRAPWLVPEATPEGAGGGTPASPAFDAPSGGPGNPHAGHTYDATRAEDDLLCGFGLDERGAIRDFNEEWQCVKELPRDTPGERLARARASLKVMSDFVDAAVQGAVAVVLGSIVPLNPAEPNPAHLVFVHNNIFFSMSNDPAAKEAERTRGGGGCGEDAASLVPANHDLAGILALNRADVPGLHTLTTVVVSYAGHRVVAQSIIPGILQAESASRLVYGSVDNGALVAAHDSVLSLLRAAAPALLIGERTVRPLAGLAGDGGGAPAPAPGASARGGAGGLAGSSAAGAAPVPFLGPIECKGIVGTDGRTYVLDFVRPAPRDPSWYESLREDAAAAGGDPGDELNSAHVALLRPELLRSFLRAREGGWNAACEAAAASGAPPPPPLATLALNVNVFTRFAAAGGATATPEELAADEAAVWDVTRHLHGVVIPALFADLRRDAGLPLDGEALTRLCHTRGVNVRYLGRLAALAAEAEAGATLGPALLELLECEMVARTARRVVDTLLRTLPAAKAAPAVAVAAFLNALLGAAPAPGGGGGGDGGDVNVGAMPPPAAAAAKKGGKAKKKAAAAAAAAAVAAAERGGSGERPLHAAPTSAVSSVRVHVPSTEMALPGDAAREALRAAALLPQVVGAATVWAAVCAAISKKFRYACRIWNGPRVQAAAVGAGAAPALSGGGGPPPPGAALSHAARWATRTHPIPLLRRLCQRCGFQVAARAYAWDSATPFSPEDVVGLVPVVKTCLPPRVLGDASESFDAGRAALNAGDVSTAFAHTNDALSLLYQAAGPLHREVANTCSTLALVLWHAGEKPAAVAQQARALQLLERLLGPDHVDVAHAHGNLAAYLAVR
jgi:protein TIF31